VTGGRRLLLVRHGVTDWNREGRFQGHKDPPLSDQGRNEARLLAERLSADPSLGPRRIVTSSLGRARQTAEVVARALGAPIADDPRLIELGQGAWEGRTHADLAEHDAERYAAWRRSRGEGEPPDGEPLADARARVADALADLLRADPWPACVVSHGGTLRLAAAQLLRLEGRRPWALDLDNASLSVLVEAGAAWRIERWNDTRHILGRMPTHVDEAEGEPLAL
jgi:broad specificity phosphatase PhoE